MDFSIFIPTIELGPPYKGALAGVRRYTYSLVSSLSHYDIDIHIATTSRPPNDDPLLEKDNVHFHFLPTIVSSRGIYSSKTHFFGENRKKFSKNAYDLYLQLNEEYNFDIIHTTELDGYAFALAKKKNALNVPLVMSAHSPVSTGTWKFNLFVQRPYRKLLKRIIPYCDKIITSSTSLLTKIGKISEKIKSKIEIIPLSLNCHIYSRIPKIEQIDEFCDKYHIEKNNKTILLLGPFIPRKSQIEIIDYFSVIKKKIPNINFLIIGNGPLLPKIKEKIVEHHLDDTAIITGYVSDEELIIAYHVSDVLLYPAEQGTFGTPIIEAMASGLSVIAADIPPMNELLSHTEQLLYPPKDYNAMVESIVKVLSEEQNANKVYELQRHALENYNYPVVGKKLLKLYESLIS
ncbi:MAG: glycosyltransferase family 4 protein [Candidatus Heimdallarchaeaceae archaeon]